MRDASLAGKQVLSTCRFPPSHKFLLSTIRTVRTVPGVCSPARKPRRGKCGLTARSSAARSANECLCTGGATCSGLPTSFWARFTSPCQSTRRLLITGSQNSKWSCKCFCYRNSGYTHFCVISPARSLFFTRNHASFSLVAFPAICIFSLCVLRCTVLPVFFQHTII